MTARLQRGEVINVSQLEELPDEAAGERQSYLLHRVKLRSSSGDLARSV